MFIKKKVTKKPKTNPNNKKTKPSQLIKQWNNKWGGKQIKHKPRKHQPSIILKIYFNWNICK